MKQVDALELISASGPFAELQDKLMLYGRLVGSWDIEATWYQQDGARRTGRGEWHFSWILGGRGIQDVLFSSGAPAHEFGTSIRCYDGALDAWHITWMQPAGGEFAHLLGRGVGDRIVQEGTAFDNRSLLRWSFTHITGDSFVWLGEVSFDDGATWFLEQEMRASRRTGP